MSEHITYQDIVAGTTEADSDTGASVASKVNSNFSTIVTTVNGLSDAMDLKLPLRTTVRDITESAILELTDANTRITCTSALQITVTIPLEADVAFTTGDTIELIQYGLGAVTVLPAVGVTILSKEAKTSTSGQYAVIVLTKMDTNTWLIIGSLA